MQAEIEENDDSDSHLSDDLIAEASEEWGFDLNIILAANKGLRTGQTYDTTMFINYGEADPVKEIILKEFEDLDYD